MVEADPYDAERRAWVITSQLLVIWSKQQNSPEDTERVVLAVLARNFTHWYGQKPYQPRIVRSDGTVVVANASTMEDQRVLDLNTLVANEGALVGTAALSAFARQALEETFGKKVDCAFDYPERKFTIEVGKRTPVHLSQSSLTR